MQRKSVFFFVTLFFLLCLQAALALFAFPSLTPNSTLEDLGYQHFNMDIAMIVFMGFGVMISYLERYSYSSLVMTLMVVSISMVFYGFMTSLWSSVLNTNIQTIDLNVSSIGKAYFCALSSIITISSTLGRLGTIQFLGHTILNVIFFSLNETIITLVLGVQDTGKTFSVFLYSGVVSLVLSSIIRSDNSANHSNAVANIRGYIFGLVGVGATWVFMSSFNCAYAATYRQSLAYNNTWLALATGTITTFMLSYYMGAKLQPFYIMFNSLSGGIAVGCSADLSLNPAAAMTLGVISSTVLYFVSKYNPLKSRQQDQYGITLLALVSGAVGTLYSCIIIAFYNYNGGYPSGVEFKRFGYSSFTTQSLIQFAGFGVCLLLGGMMGVVSGVLIKVFFQESFQSLVEVKGERQNDKYRYYDDQVQIDVSFL